MTERRPLAALVLAAGKGTRMRSSLPKVLHPLLGRPLVWFPLTLARELGAAPIVAVLGHGASVVGKVIPEDVQIAIQAEPLGTADAVRVGLAALGEFEGEVLVLSGDVPLLTRGTLEKLLLAGGPVALVTAFAADPSGYGRILRGADGHLQRIVEEKDADVAQRSVREINAGLYRFESGFLREHLGKVTAQNAQQELYLTDLVALAAAAGGVRVVTAPLAEVSGINDRRELSRAAASLRATINARHQAEGVTLVDPAATYIDLSVVLGRDVTIEPGCVLIGQTRVEAGSVLRAHSVLEDAHVGPGCTIGPFARLRPGTTLAAGVHIGNFVETKNARLGAGTKANHLSYLGDAEVGARVNVGAGTITCNYDGEKKSMTTLGDDVFIGSDTQLVAPVTVGAGAYVGAGSTIDTDVPADSLVFTRAARVVKEGWAKRKRESRGPAKV